MARCQLLPNILYIEWPDIASRYPNGGSVAGQGALLLPATKSVPNKSMTLVD
jgi:hypothetical protein